jgi:enoyl-CoA hydratase
MSMVTVTREGHVATVTLDRPEKRNALNPDFWEGFPGVIEALDLDPEVRVIILRGAGSCFSAGLDVPATMPWLPAPGGAPDGAAKMELHRKIRVMQRSPTALERARVPVIAAIHGPCIGAGVDIITACDVRLASADARFSVRETRLAMVADIGTLQRLPAIVGPGIARELVFTGEDFGAERAASIGLVNRVLPTAEALFAEAQRVAEAIASNPPLTVQGAKQVLNEGVRYDIDRQLEYVATWNTAHVFTQDLAAAMTGFMTKQPPTFVGK